MGIKDKIGDMADKVTGKGDDNDSPDKDTKDVTAADAGAEPAEAEVEGQDPMRIPPPQMHEIDPSGKVSNNYP